MTLRSPFKRIRRLRPLYFEQLDFFERLNKQIYEIFFSYDLHKWPIPTNGLNMQSY